MAGKNPPACDSQPYALRDVMWDVLYKWRLRASMVRRSLFSCPVEVLSLQPKTSNSIIFHLFFT